MTTQQENSVPLSNASRPLRIWPALLLLALVGAAKATPYLLTEFTPKVFTFVAFAPLIAGIGLLVWWMFASRATRAERWLGPLGVVLVAGAAYALMDQSLKGMGFMFYTLPTGVAAVLLALVLLRMASPTNRVWGAVFAAIIGFASWDVARNDGLWGDFKSSFHWRWEPTAEERLLASLSKENPSAVQTPSTGDQIEEPTWSDFRGAKRDGIVRGIVIDTDWQSHSPKELWRRRVGPGWSSFSVAGHSIFTQEQRGNAEVVVCYDADTGAERWVHESPARFWESVAGAGPRATPTLKDGLLFSVGATGLMHCLNPSTGALIWERDLAKDAARQPLMWGFASSPLIVDDLMIVYAGGADDKGVFAYDAKTGEPRWSVPAGDHSYSSPQRATIAGRDVVLMLTNTGISAIDPAVGKNIWSYDWKYEGYRAIQPLVLGESDIVVGTGMGTGTRRVTVAMSDSTPQITDQWTSLEMKPDFNDYVAHKGFLYGFDHNIFACIDLETGKRNWKKGRYGNGQVLLLPDADQLLILTETGEVVVVRTNPKSLEELARIKVLNGKTWNHPVLVENRLYVRNGEEAACLELPLIQSISTSQNDDTQ